MIYFVTDRTLCSKEHYLKVIEKSCEAGVEAIILREKDLSSEELLALAVEVKIIVEGTNTKLIVNSNIEVAKAIKVDGVHLSYKDFMDYKDIKQVKECCDLKVCATGQDLNKSCYQNLNKLTLTERIYDGIVGVSVHSVEEGIIAYKSGADYIMYGHVFKSSCKKDLPPRGVEDLAKLKNVVSIPIVAIGGINSSNFKEALNAGADKIAIRSGILKCDNVFEYLGEFIDR